MRAKLVKEHNEIGEISKIFTGAVWSSQEDGQMKLRLLPDGTVYGRGEDFDFERDSKEAALTQLKKWGYHYIGAE